MRRFLLLTILLAGCGAHVPTQYQIDTFHSEMNYYWGKPITELVHFYGYPDYEGYFQGVKKYVWSRDRIHVSHSPIAGDEATYLHGQCKLTVLVRETKDGREVIDSYDLHGNNIGCKHYIMALN